MSSQSSSSMSRNTSQANCLDPLDALIDFSEYEQVSYQSPSISPSTSSKPQFVRPVASTPTASNALLSSSQPILSGPSHPYDLHKQQTGIPAGGLATTLAINSQQAFGGYGYMSGLTPSDDFDFNTPRQASFGGVDMDMEFDSPSTEPAFFYPEHSVSSSSGFVNPSAIGGQENQVMAPTVLPTQSSNVGRLWPGMHQQQAALAKAQQQQKQQEQLIQQQRQNSVGQQQPKQQRSKTRHASDPIVEEKISQLLNTMRQSSVATSEGDDMTPSNGSLSAQARLRKDEEDMDEDERLLASEEGKKLSSKERRQLRNKVSARAFRSRRKEYISQLEGEIAVKVNENSDLRTQNRALMEENTRLSDLTRMLLSSPSFSGFLDTLTTTTSATVAPQTQASISNAAEQRPAENRQVRKDVNPYAAQQVQNQQVNFAILPEQTMDFSMLDLNTDGSYVYQPQVFTVMEMPETAIDTNALTGKTSNFVEKNFDSEEQKIELPTVKRLPTDEKRTTPKSSAVVDDTFDSDPAFVLFTDSASTDPESPKDLDLTPIFGGIEPEKALAHFELVDAVESEVRASKAMARVQRICASLEAVTARLEAMTADL